METTILAGLLCFVLVLASVLAWTRTQRTQRAAEWEKINQTMVGLQTSLLEQQREQSLQAERVAEMKNSTLRQELSQTLEQSRTALSEGLSSTAKTLEERVTKMDERLDKRLDAMAQGVQGKLEANLKEGFFHFEKVQEHLKHTQTKLAELSAVGQSIHDLNNLLKLPHLRGGFGEASLERMLSDILPKESFELQYRIVAGSAERVDAVIRYPNGLLPIDSKFPREQVLPLFETSIPSKLEAARKQLSEVMRSLGKQIREKYIRPDHGTTDMALLFVPSETLYFEILRHPKLFEDLSRQKVFAVSPNTLAVTLHAVATSRKYYEMAKGVEKTLIEVKKARQHYESFEKRFGDVGITLNKAQTAYNVATTHLNRYSGAVLRLTGEKAGTEPTPIAPAEPTQPQLET